MSARIEPRLFTKIRNSVLEMQLKLAKIGISHLTHSSDRRPHRIWKEVGSETSSKMRNADLQHRTLQHPVDSSRDCWDFSLSFFICCQNFLTGLLTATRVYFSPLPPKSPAACSKHYHSTIPPPPLYSAPLVRVNLEYHPFFRLFPIRDHWVGAIIFRGSLQLAESTRHVMIYNGNMLLYW